MLPSVRTLLNLLSIVVTGFFVLVFLVGDWVGVYGGDVWLRLLWVGMLFSLQPFLGATCKPSGRSERRIGWAKWGSVVLGGLFLAVVGFAGTPAYVLRAPGLSLATAAVAIGVGLLLAAQGLWMIVWASRHPEPVTVSNSNVGKP